MNWRRKKCKVSKKRLKAISEQLAEAIAEDEREKAKKGSGLPKDWRNRIFKR